MKSSTALEQKARKFQERFFLTAEEIADFVRGQPLVLPGEER